MMRTFSTQEIAIRVPDRGAQNIRRDSEGRHGTV
jgi:hypothetical protein